MSQRAPHPALSWILAPRGDGRAEALRRAVEGKRVLLTGASFGIGAALARRLGAAGAELILAARSEAELGAVAREIAAAGGRAQVCALDLTSPEQIARAAEALARQGGAEVVIHNAGKSIRRSIARSLDRPHDFSRTMAVNYLGPVQLQLALLPAMLERGSGHLVNVSTLGIRLPVAPRWAAYLASKQAFDTWITAAAPELRHRGITCTSVYLGLVHTRMSAPTPDYQGMPGQTPDQAAQVLCRALIQRPRRISPWWVSPARWLAPALERPIEWTLGQLFLRGDDSVAARGERA